MKLSIVCPIYENETVCQKFLASLKVALNHIHSEWEVLIVDDGSKKDLSFLKQHYPFITYIKMEKNRGAAAARNIGVQRASGEYIIFFDSDVVLYPDTIKKYESLFIKGEKIVVGDYESESLTVGMYPRIKGLITKAWMPKTEYVSFFSTPNGAIQRAIFQEIGGFNETFRSASVEEYEFSDRLLKSKKYKVYYDRSLLVKHHYPSFLKQCHLYYKRSRDIMPLMILRRFKTFGWGVTQGEALSAILGTTLCVLIPVFFYLEHSLLFLSILCVGGLFIFCNRPFLRVVLKEKEFGLFIYAFVAKLLMGIPIVWGAWVGSGQFLGEILKKRLTESMIFFCSVRDKEG